MIRRALGVALVLVVVGAGPALADPPGPTDYESVVVALDPAADGVDVAVLGGDSFLQVTNDGHEVLVRGYDGEEEYLRFDPDGTVSVNLRSVAYWQNEDRYANVQVPEPTGPDVPPQWEVVATDGTWSWHDHRIHWMSPTTLPGDVDPTLDVEQVAFDWPVPIEVDGTEVMVTGTLTWLPPASPLPTALAAVGMFVLAWVLARGGRRRALVAVVGLTVVVTGVVGATMLVGLPAGVTADSFPVVLSGITAVVLAAGLAMRGRALGMVVAGLSGIPLLVWAVTQWAAVTAPVVPPDVVPAVVVRLAVGMALGAGVAALALAAVDVFSRPLAGLGDTTDSVAPGSVAT